MTQRLDDSDGGFTLLEILIVLVVLGVASGIAVIALGGTSKTGARGACKNDYQSTQAAAELYRQQTGVFPGGSLSFGNTSNPKSPSVTTPASWDAVQYLLGTITTSSGGTLGPWLQETPASSGHYQIAAQDNGSGIRVYSTDNPPAQIGATSTVADCQSVN